MRFILEEHKTQLEREIFQAYPTAFSNKKQAIQGLLIKKPGAGEKIPAPGFRKTGLFLQLFDRDGLDYDILRRLIVPAAGDVCNRIDHVHPLIHLAKYRVAKIEPRSAALGAIG